MGRRTQARAKRRGERFQTVAALAEAVRETAREELEREHTGPVFPAFRESVDVEFRTFPQRLEALLARESRIREALENLSTAVAALASVGEDARAWQDIGLPSRLVAWAAQHAEERAGVFRDLLSVNMGNSASALTTAPRTPLAWAIRSVYLDRTLGTPSVRKAALYAITMGYMPQTTKPRELTVSDVIERACNAARLELGKLRQVLGSELAQMDPRGASR